MYLLTYLLTSAEELELI